MQQALPLSTLLAARQALVEQQIRALRDWLGEDHELLTSRADTSVRAAPEALRTWLVARAQISEEVSR